MIFIIKKKKKSAESRFSFKPVYMNEAESFFGYYDKSPVSEDMYTLCCISGHATENKPDAKVPVTLALFAPDKESEPILEIPVNVYNWQQACRAFWLTKDLFIFNDFDPDKHKYVSKVYSKRTLACLKIFDYPVQDAYRDKYFVSVNYRRLMSLRPDYGYRNLPAMQEEELHDTENDGIWFIDFETEEAQLIISLETLKNFSPSDNLAFAVHKVNHVMISPDGNKLIFIHRYFCGRRRYDRLFVYEIGSGTLALLADNEMISHCSWFGNQTVFGYLRGANGKDGYWFIDLKDGVFYPFESAILDGKGDGHPHICGDFFITDTYPDKSRMQHLFLGNLKTGVVEEIGEFFHGFNFSGETRCDLHPRISPNGRYVFFDSVFTGKRHLYRMDLDR